MHCYIEMNHVAFDVTALLFIAGYVTSIPKILSILMLFLKKKLFYEPLNCQKYTLFNSI